jgi:hypothetical protein
MTDTELLVSRRAWPTRGGHIGMIPAAFADAIAFALA